MGLISSSSPLLLGPFNPYYGILDRASPPRLQDYPVAGLGGGGVLASAPAGGRVTRRLPIDSPRISAPPTDGPPAPCIWKRGEGGMIAFHRNGCVRIQSS